MASLMLGNLVSALAIQGAAVFTSQGSSSHLELAGCVGFDPEDLPRRISRDGLLLQHIQRHDGAASDPWAAQGVQVALCAPADVGLALDGLAAEAIVLLTAVGQLQAMVVLGRKQDGSSYADDDVTLATLALRPLAMACENGEVAGSQAVGGEEWAAVEDILRGVQSAAGAHSAFRAAMGRLQQIMELDAAVVGWLQPRDLRVRVVLTYANGGHSWGRGRVVYSIPNAECWRQAHQGRHTESDPRAMALCPVGLVLARSQMQSIACFPIDGIGGAKGQFVVGSRLPGAFQGRDLRVLGALKMHIAAFAQIHESTMDARLVRRRLMKLDKERSDFIEVIAHEIKTPLSTLFASAELLVHETDECSMIGEMARALHGGARAVVGSVSDLAAFARIHKADFALSLSEVDMCELVQSVVLQCRNLLAQKSQMVAENVPHAPCNVRGDRVRLQQVLLNLLSNAIKFSSPGSRMEVQVSPARRGFVRVDVADAAPPIPGEEVRQLFKPHFRGTLGQGAGGLGLGLAVTRRLVTLHGGSVKVWRAESGNVFSISIPAAG